MPNIDAERWVQAAEDDLQAAELLLRDRIYNLSAFHAQQTAEKALEGLLRTMNEAPWGHNCVELLRRIREIAPELSVTEELSEAVTNLDEYYISSRYPDAFETGKPADFYDEMIAQEALDDAKFVMEFVRGNLYDEQDDNNSSV
jgi:HEPN domain-containing protein